MKKKEQYDDEEKKNPRGKKNKKSGIGLALWVLAALVLIIVFLVEQNKIISNLKEADFFHRVFGKTPAFVENHEVAEPKESDKNDVAPIDISVLNGSDTDHATPAVPQDTGIVAENEAAKEQSQKADEAKNDSAKESAASTQKPTEQKPTVSKPAETKPVKPEVPSLMNIKLFFIDIGSDGSVNRHEVTRKMKKSDSPLVDAINALIVGPTTQEESAGCRSLIPTSSKLLGASVKDGVATLNFSGEFEFNQYGVEGTLGQLQQIVYTATAFHTVESVQFLVDGELKDYLGSEGVWIGTPLNRNNFK